MGHSLPDPRKHSAWQSDPHHRQAGFKFLVTAWSIEQTGGPACYPGRDMKESHADLNVTEFELGYRSMVVGPAEGDADGA